jgi:hypothetical protein
MHMSLTQQQRNECPCGAVANHPGGQCRKCLARLAWRERHANPRRGVHHRRRSTGRLSHERARNLALAAAAARHTRTELELS